MDHVIAMHYITINQLTVNLGPVQFPWLVIQPPPSSPFSELLRVFLHALVLSKLHQLAGGTAHVDGSGPGWGQVAQRLPDEGHRVITPSARPQLHSQAEAADDGDGRGTTHLEEKEKMTVVITAWSSSLVSMPTSERLSLSFHEDYNLAPPQSFKWMTMEPKVVTTAITEMITSELE